MHVPSTELLIHVVSLFNVSLGYLAFENRQDLQQVQIADCNLLQKLKAIDRLTDVDRTTTRLCWIPSSSKTAFSNSPRRTRSK